MLRKPAYIAPATPESLARQAAEDQAAAEAARLEAQAAESEIPGELSEAQFDWVKSHSRRWAKGNQVRYYIDLDAALTLADENNPDRTVLGLSKNKSFAQRLSWKVYFDAIAGKLEANGTAKEIFGALWWGLENRLNAGDQRTGERPL